MNITQLNSIDQELLALYSDVDTGSGAAFDDEDCSRLVDGWRDVVTAEIARHARKNLVICTSSDGWSSPAREMISTSRQRFVRDSGRDSSMRTVSPGATRYCLPPVLMTAYMG